MISELRRAKRYTDYLPVDIHAINGVTGQTVAGPFSSRIIDISNTGACLLMTQIMCDSYHVFHSTREDDSYYLQLKINLPPDLAGFSLSARPIWMNFFHQDQIHAYKMGVEFLVNPEGEKIKKLMAAMARQQEKRAQWWSSHALRKAGPVSMAFFSGH